MFRIVRRLMRNDLRFALRVSEVLLQKRKFDCIIWWHRTYEWSHWTFITIEGELKFTHTQMQARACVLGPFGKWLFILSNLAVRHFVCSDFYAHATEKSCGYFKSKKMTLNKRRREPDTYGSKHWIFHQNRKTVLKGHAISFCAQDNNASNF